MLNKYLYKCLGIVIRNKRKFAGLTQTDLAGKIALSRVSITNIEAGRQQVYFDRAVHLSEILGFDLANVENDSKKFHKQEQRRTQALLKKTKATVKRLESSLKTDKESR